MHLMKNSYSVAVLQPQKTSYIEEAANTLSWGGDRITAARHFEFEAVRVEGKTDFPIGSAAILYDTDSGSPKEIMRGFIVSRKKKGKSDLFTYKCYDLRWWLVKNKWDRKFTNAKASDIFMDICKSFEIPYGEVADTGYTFDLLHIIDKTLWDTLTIALTETRKRNSQKFVCKVIDGKLCLVERKTQLHTLIIEEGGNLIDSDYEESIEDMYTRVTVKGQAEDNTPLYGSKQDDAAADQYGCMVEQISQTEATTQSAVDSIAAEKLRELCQLRRDGRITALGLNSLEAGDAVYVIDSETGLIGGFYVESDEHKVSNRHHTMDISLAWTDELPSLDYTPPTT